MNMQSFDMWTVIILLMVGVYCIFQSIVLKKAEKLPEKSALILPPNCAPHQCKNPKGYMSEISPKLLILGIGMSIFAGIQGICMGVGFDNQYVMIALMILPLCVVVWYIFQYKKLLAKYWSM